MKFIKKMTTIFVSILMLSSVAHTIFANSYYISIENTNPSISIDTNVYNAYLLFESVEGQEDAYVFNPDTCLAIEYKPTGSPTLSGNDLLMWLSDPNRTTQELYDFSVNIYNNFININHPPTPSGSATANNQRADIPLNIAGYYMVSGGGERYDNHSPITALASLSVVNPTAVINPKFDVPSLEKLVYHDAVNSYTNHSDHGIGDSVLYQISTAIPTTTGYASYQYSIRDTLDSGLTFNDDYVLKASTTNGIITISDAYYELVSPSSGSTFQVDVDILGLMNEGIVSSSDTFISEYSATLNEMAIIHPEGTNDNQAILLYSNDPHNLHSLGETPVNITKSYTFEMTLMKTDVDSHVIEGAEFVMTLEEELVLDAQGNPTNALSFIQSKPDVYILAPQDYDAHTTTLLQAGNIKIQGLNAHTKYYLHEIKAPDSYVLNTDPIAIQLLAMYDETSGEILEGYPSMLINEETQSVAPILEVVNYKKADLPNTGANQSMIFIGLGLFFTSVGIGILFIKKRKTKNAQS